MISEIDEAEATMNPVKGNPPAKPNPSTHVIFRQLAAEPCSTDPFKSIFKGYWGLFRI